MERDEGLDVLLIEDNPGDVRLIEEMLEEATELLQHFDFDDRFADGMTVHHEATLETGIQRSTSADVDVILLDLGLPHSTGLETLDAVTDATTYVPIIVLTGLDDEAIGIRAIQSGAQDYLVKGEVNSDLLVRSIHYALERTRQERDRARRREQLESLNRLNRIGHDVTHAVITTSTRDELERAVCERLVAADAYRFAWIGEVDRANDRVTPRVAAGVEDGYLDDVTITIEDDETAQGPAGRAVRTGDVQVMQDVQTDPAYEPWREQAIDRGYRSGASVPIHHEELLYGVLNVYAISPNAFSEPEVEILSRLGEVIGHAITAIERKEALVSDTVLELEFEVEVVDEELSRAVAGDGRRVALETFVRTNDAVLAYGRAVGIPQPEFREAIAETTLVDELRILSPEAEDAYEFEVLTTAAGPLVDAVATHGGRLGSATLDVGGLRFVVEFPPGRDRRQLIEIVRDHCSDADNRAQRVVERSPDDARAHDVLHDALTEKQRTVLRTAHSAGLYEWPRQSTGQELADRLGISPATFSQHLRSAEQKFFDAVFRDDEDGIRDTEK